MWFIKIHSIQREEEKILNIVEKYIVEKCILEPLHLKIFVANRDIFAGIEQQFY